MKIEAHGYALEIHPTGEYSISRKGCEARINKAGVEIDSLDHGTIAVGSMKLQALDSTGDRAVVRLSDGRGYARLEFRVAEEGVYIDMAARYPGPLGRLSPLLAGEGDGSSLDVSKNIHHLRFMRPGYQSWSPSGSWSILKKEPFPFIGLIERGSFHPNIGFKPKAGHYHNDYATVVADPKTGACVSIGFVSAYRSLSGVDLELTSDPEGASDRLEARAYSDLEYASTDANAERRSETLLVSIGSDPHALWERYLDELAVRMNARKKLPMPVGWCSWYHYFVMVTEKALMANLAEMKKRRAELGVDVFQLDDGYCVVGDWLEWNEKFPNGPAKLASEISAAGFTPGLWIAPFICTRASRVFKEHPEWILKNDKGKPVMAGINPLWKGRAFYALDMTHPGALDYIGKVMRTAVEWGFRYIKIDFVYAALLRGVRHDRSKTGLEAYRAGLKVIREALGDDIFLLGCGAPIAPSVGYVDGMRVSADVAQYWRSRITRTIAGAPCDPSAENAIHGTVCRSAMHGRLWHNDPDCLLVRKKKSLLTIDEVRSLATAIFMSGGMLLMSDDMTALDPERWEIIRACLPPSEKAARPVDLFSESDPRFYHLDMGDGSSLLAIFNWKGARSTPRIDPAMIGLKGPHYAFEFWTGRYAGLVDGAPKDLPFALEPHGVALLRLTPATDNPRVVGTSLHMGMGMVEVKEERVAGKKLEVEIKLTGPRKGKIYVAIPGVNGAAEIKTIDVSFTDGATVEIDL